MNNLNTIKCRCGRPIDASNPHVGATLGNDPICVRCIVKLSLPVSAR